MSKITISKKAAEIIKKSYHQTDTEEFYKLIDSLTDIKKNCRTCNFEMVNSEKEPCLPCSHYDRWQPKGEL